MTGVRKKITSIKQAPRGCLGCGVPLMGIPFLAYNIYIYISIICIPGTIDDHSFDWNFGLVLGDLQKMEVIWARKDLTW